MTLTPEAGRVLGCLVEKQLTTPQQYPLTLNALTMAANQATNRDPVVTLDEDRVLGAIDELRELRLVRVVLPSHGRSVKRYRHVLDEVYGLDAPRCALMASLLLRGPQTVGELRARTERMVDFPSTGDVQDELAALDAHSEGLARLQPRRPGQKEDRWHQVMAEPWGQAAATGGGDGGPRPDARGGDVGRGAGDGRDAPGAVPAAADPATGSGPEVDVEALRTGLESLRDEVAALRQELDSLRRGLGG